MKKSQVSIEFIVFVAFGILLLIILLPISFEKTKDLNSNKEYMLLNDVSFRVQNEIHIASIVEDGYQRVFEIPSTINNKHLEISHNSTFVKISTGDFVKSIRIPYVEGTLKIGKNVIKKENGIVYVNQ